MTKSTARKAKRNKTKKRATTKLPKMTRADWVREEIREAKMNALIYS